MLHVDGHGTILIRLKAERAVADRITFDRVGAEQLYAFFALPSSFADFATCLTLPGKQPVQQLAPGDQVSRQLGPLHLGADECQCARLDCHADFPDSDYTMIPRGCTTPVEIGCPG